VFRKFSLILKSKLIITMSILSKTILLLCVSNFFMLCAWYLHLKWFGDKHWFIAALISWGIAFVEYNFHIPANRIGSQALSLPQLQILQIGMSLLLFIPFSILVMNKPIKLDYIWATCCIIMAAFFIFRK
jgi:uncharacterized protein (DUF486 family)